MSQKINIICVTGTREKLQMAAMIASVAAATGDEVSVFLSMNAIPYFVKGHTEDAPVEGELGALMAKEKGGPEIKSQILMWLVADSDFERASWKEFGADRFLSAPLMKWMWDLYIPEADARRAPHATPLNASIDELRGLPPALIQVAENDILRDGGEAYGRKLDEAGVDVTTIRYDGMIHDFGLLNALANEPATKSLFVHAAAELKRRLGK